MRVGVGVAVGVYDFDVQRNKAAGSVVVGVEWFECQFDFGNIVDDFVARVELFFAFRVRAVFERFFVNQVAACE